VNPSPFRDTLVGVFLLAGLAAMAYLSVSLGGLTYANTGGLRLTATFDEIGGLKPRAQVVIGGVKVGQVERIELAEDFRARVVLDVERSLALPDDSSASILTAGLLGDQYIAIEPGGSEQTLADGGSIPYTQSAVVLERILGKLVQSFSSAEQNGGKQ
jgi:phospholipid/cholesterol/gamma-HCH transport system substrate-binding protein